MDLVKNWDKVKMYDLTQNLSHLTPPWPTYEPLQIKFFKRLAPNGANGQLLTTSNHVGTHLDGPMHFVTSGRDIASLELDKLIHPGVIVDLSDITSDFSIYTPEDIEERVEVKEGDILIINTGYHKYGWDQPEADERRYMLRHPGPSMSFIDWAKEKKIRWLGIDAGSMDHPMNTKIRDWEPGEAKIADETLKELYGKGLDELYPWPDVYQATHTMLFPEPWEIIHAENVGGEIDKLSNKRVLIGVFPLKFEGGESSMARIVAFDTDGGEEE